MTENSTDPVDGTRDSYYETALAQRIEREFQITDNGQVNWAPYWHPSGNFIVYGSSEEGHQNYEVFAVEVDRGVMEAAAKSTDAATVPVAARRLLSGCRSRCTKRCSQRRHRGLRWSSTMTLLTQRGLVRMRTSRVGAVINIVERSRWSSV